VLEHLDAQALGERHGPMEQGGALGVGHTTSMPVCPAADIS
jgi:hypothetical protein